MTKQEPRGPILTMNRVKSLRSLILSILITISLTCYFGESNIVGHGVKNLHQPPNLSWLEVDVMVLSHQC